MKFVLASVLAMTVAAPVLAGSHASGDPAEGEKVFRKCKACHMIESADGESIQSGGRVGPNLWGVAQRQPGSLDGFNYGDDIVAAGEALGETWSEAEFVTYVANPTDWLKAKLDAGSARSKMAFRLGDEEEAKNVWAYLVSVGPEGDMTN